MIKWYVKFGLGLLVAGVLVSLAFLLVEYPKNHPDKMLEWEEKAANYFEKFTLPIKVARLSAREPDTQVLVPVYGLPVSGITDTWEAPRGEGERVHQGQDIFAESGTPIFSGTYGYVHEIGVGKIAGNYVYVLGAGGRRYYYAHLERFANNLHVGQEVDTDTVTGFVGNTGNAINTPPHLHFEINLPDTTPINPLPFLVNR
ncbi:MAG: hypothetical protein A3J48_03435 [Candidatus Doudnabacteria bacterium RIFCSPHIGHO2_02_FULL_46_11]|uniref:M23ase beta-sheet core domain-containing protein n=1 Tax=Candidatus Doudnabacteria bacterium RIFCSPHIGHO2_02_FULL_46_11 TaxID=1817832 RepID=A0A1F5P4M3_9BACT|nr:MAG: hypothetical protein A3J48_03435 [Candidatus Doudnabacteria bacterium RIFCSPHIGHO2_02_FULL_46_11]